MHVLQVLEECQKKQGELASPRACVCCAWGRVKRWCIEWRMAGRGGRCERDGGADVDGCACCSPATRLLGLWARCLQAQQGRAYVCLWGLPGKPWCPAFE